MPQWLPWKLEVCALQLTSLVWLVGKQTGEYVSPVADHARLDARNKTELVVKQNKLDAHGFGHRIVHE